MSTCELLDPALPEERTFILNFFLVSDNILVLLPVQFKINLRQIFCASVRGGHPRTSAAMVLGRLSATEVSLSKTPQKVGR